MRGIQGPKDQLCGSFLFFVISLDKLLKKQSHCPSFETPWHSHGVIAVCLCLTSIWPFCATNSTQFAHSVKRSWCRQGGVRVSFLKYQSRYHYKPTPCQRKIRSWQHISHTTQSHTTMISNLYFELFMIRKENVIWTRIVIFTICIKTFLQHTPPHCYAFSVLHHC